MSTAPTLTFNHDLREDRLFLLVGPEAPPTVLVLTRRMTQRIARGLAGALEKMNPTVQRAPAAMRSEVVRMAHQASLAQTKRGQTEWTAAGAMAQGQAPRLVSRIDLHTRPGAVRLDFFDNEDVVARLPMTPAELHQVLQTLLSFAERAEWGLGTVSDWLAPEPASTPARTRLAQ